MDVKQYHTLQAPAFQAPEVRPFSKTGTRTAMNKYAPIIKHAIHAGGGTKSMTPNNYKGFIRASMQ